MPFIRKIYFQNTAAVPSEVNATKQTRVIKWLERRDCDRHGLRSKPTRAILLCPWKRHLAAFSCYLVALASSSKFLSYLYKTKKLIKKFQADSNILASPEAGRDNCLPYALAPSMLACVSEG